MFAKKEISTTFFFLLVAVLLLGQTLPVHASGTGTISGIIRDVNNKPVTGIPVSVRVLRKSDGNQVAMGYSNPVSGAYTLTGLPLNTPLTVVASDFEPEDGFDVQYYNYTGGLDWAETIVLTTSVPTRAGINFSLSPASPFIIEHLTFNTRPGRLLNDINLRKAIAYGTNRQALLENAWEPYGTTGDILHVLLPDSFRSLADPADLTIYPYNEAQAETLLTNAGWIDNDLDGIRENAGGQPLELDFITTTAPARVATTNLFQTQMLAIGIRVNVQTYPPDVLFSTNPAVSPLVAGDFDIVEFAWVFFYYGDMLAGLYNTGNEQNYGGYSNPVLDGYYSAAQAAKVAGNLPAFQANALLWQQTYTADLPSLPLFSRIRFGHIAGRVFQADGSTPIANMPVSLVNRANNEMARVCTDSDGSFTFDKVRHGIDWYLMAVPDSRCPGQPEGYVREYWQEARSIYQATAIRLGDEQPDYDGVLFTLDIGETISGVLGASGGTIQTPGEIASVLLPPGAVSEDTLFTITDTGAGYQSGTNQGDIETFLSFSIGPKGMTFSTPVTLTFQWLDNDNDGLIDSTSIPEGALYLSKDGTILAGPCSTDVACNLMDNTVSVQVSSLSFFALGTIAPLPTVVSITRASNSPTGASGVDFLVTFSEPVTGVDRYDFSALATGSLSGVSVTQVTGSGATRVVTVAIGEGNGTLRLDIPATATITDLLDNPLSGLPYTAGETYEIARGPLPSTWVGGIAIHSNQPVVAVARPHAGAEVASYIGLTAGSTTQYVPMLFKGAFGGDYNSALYLQNVSAETATLTMEFANSAGAIVYAKSDTLPPYASKGYWLPAETGLPNGFAGGVRVTSSQPVLAVGRPHINGQVMTYNGMGAGSTTAWLPMFFKNGFGNYNSALYVQNVSPSNASLTIQFLNPDGTIACAKADTLAANASKGYWSLSVACDAGSLPMGFVGGVKIISSQPILAVERAHLGTQVTTFNGFVDGTFSAYVPMLFRNAFANGSYKAALYLQNVSDGIPDVTNPAAVTIEYIDNNGVVTATQNVMLVAGAVSSIWLPSVPGLADGFAGGARISSTEEIVAVGRPHLGAEIAAYNGAPLGGLTTYLPMLFKNAFDNYQSAFYIQNTSGSPANVDIRFYDSAGVLSCVKTINLAPYATQGFWMPTVACGP